MGFTVVLTQEEYSEYLRRRRERNLPGGTTNDNMPKTSSNANPSSPRKVQASTPDPWSTLTPNSPGPSNVFVGNEADWGKNCLRHLRGNEMGHSQPCCSASQSPRERSVSTKGGMQCRYIVPPWRLRDGTSLVVVAQTAGLAGPVAQVPARRWRA